MKHKKDRTLTQKGKHKKLSYSQLCMANSVNKENFDYKM